jgi:hypothetical protein
MACLKTGREMGNKKGRDNENNKVLSSFSLSIVSGIYLQLHSENPGNKGLPHYAVVFHTYMFFRIILS